MQEINVQEIQDTTLILRLKDIEGTERALVSPDGKWVLTPDDERRQTWSVTYTDFGLSVPLYKGVPLKYALVLLQDAANVQDVALLDRASLAS